MSAEVGESIGETPENKIAQEDEHSRCSGRNGWARVLLVYLTLLVGLTAWIPGGPAEILASSFLSSFGTNILPVKLAIGLFNLWLISFPVAFFCSAAVGSRLAKGKLAGFLASLFIGTLSAFAFGVLFYGGLSIPNVLVLGFILLFSLFGSWLGGTWVRSNSAAGWLFRQTIFLGGVLLVLPLFLSALCLSDEDAVVEAPALTTQDRRRIAMLLHDHDPRRLPADQVGELELSQRDLNQIANWGLVVLPGRNAARIRLQEGRGSLSVSVQPPVMAGLNALVRAELGGTLAVSGGTIEFKPDQISVGRASVPGPLLRFAGPFRLDDFQEGVKKNPMFDSVQDFQISDRSIRVVYRSIDVQRGLFRDLLVQLGAIDDLEAATSVYIEALMEKSDAAAGAIGMEELMQVAFELAAERSRGGGEADKENGYAILALGYLTGHPSVKIFLGPGVPVPNPQMRARFGRVSLHGRRDCLRHFILSSTITVLSNEMAGMDVALLKEELDAQGGSGFSFADLLADRAGVHFAVESTRSPHSAMATQRFITEGFKMGDVAPQFADLPEGIQDQQFQQEYGGVGGDRYLGLITEIDERISRCKLYQSQHDIR